MTEVDYGEYGYPNEDDDDNCMNCGEDDCDYNECIENAFLGDSASLVEGVDFDNTPMDGPLVENDTFLVLAQEEVSSEEFNERVKEIYTEMEPDKEFTGWSFTLTYEEPDDEDVRAGVFTATEEYAEAVEKALNEIAQGLNDGEYAIEHADGW